MSETTIGISDEVKKKLDLLKQHPRETYQDTIVRLIDFLEIKTKERTDLMKGKKQVLE